MILDKIRCLAAYKSLLDSIQNGQELAPLGMMRTARFPILAGLWQDLQRPIFYITDRQDKASSAVDELGFWQRGAQFYSFTEPTTLFYEENAWSSNVRQDRLEALARLAKNYLPGHEETSDPPMLFASAKSVMTRTVPRRDFIKSILRISTYIKTSSKAIN